MIAPILGFFSFVGFFVWAAFMVLAKSLSGMGDGAGSGASKYDFMIGYSGCVYLFLVFISCFPFMRGSLLAVVGFIAHVILVLFAAYAFTNGGLGSIIVLIPFACIAAGWYSLYKSRKGIGKA